MREISFFEGDICEKFKSKISFCILDWSRYCRSTCDCSSSRMVQI